MTHRFDRLVDRMLDQALQRDALERGIDRAWRRNECDAAGRRRMRQTCREMHRLEARQRRGLVVEPSTLNSARGRCAQAVAAQRLCLGATGSRTGAQVRNEFRTRPHDRSSTRPDLLPHFGVGPAPRSLLESKHVHLPSYLRGGQIDEARLRQRVREEADSIRQQRADLRSPGARPELRNVGLRTLFQIGSLPHGTPGRAALMAEARRVILAEARAQREPVVVADADALRLQVMRHAAQAGF